MMIAMILSIIWASETAPTSVCVYSYRRYMAMPCEYCMVHGQGVSCQYCMVHGAWCMVHGQGALNLVKKMSSWSQQWPGGDCRRLLSGRPVLPDLGLTSMLELPPGWAWTLGRKKELEMGPHCREDDGNNRSHWKPGFKKRWRRMMARRCLDFSNRDAITSLFWPTNRTLQRLTWLVCLQSWI